MNNDHLMPPSEPEFVGVGRRLLIDGLLAVFDRVVSSRVPLWVSLEAPAGWGKSRIVREFHTRLAAEHQHELGYWSPTIFESTPQDFDRNSEQTPISTPSISWWSVPASIRDLSNDAIATSLTQFAETDSPRVIFLEDFHLVGKQFAEHLAKWTTSDSALLVITTSRPELGDENEHGHCELDTAQERIFRINPYLKDFPYLFPAGSSLAPLDSEVCAGLVRFYYPHATSDTLERLIDHYETPLALKLFCSIEEIRLRFPDGNLHLEPWEVNQLPRNVEDLYRAIWQEVPTGTRVALAVTSAGVPVPTYGEHTANDLGWRFPLLFTALARFHRTDADDLTTALTNSIYSPLWAQRLSEVFGHFLDDLQWPWALEDVPDLSEDLRPPLLDSLAGMVEDSLDEEANDNTDFESQVDLLYRAQLSLSLHGMQRISPDSLSHVVHKALVAMEESPHLLSSRVKLGKSTLAALEAGSWPWCLIAQIHGSTLLDNGQAKTAIALFEDELWAVTRRLGSDDAVVLRTRHCLASALEEDGQMDEAIVLYENVVTVQQRVQGPYHLDTLVSLHNLAYAYGNAGRADEAIEMFEDLIVIQQRVQGPDHPETLTSLDNLAGVYEKAGHLDQAIDYYKRVAADRQRVLGSEHPDTLESQNNLAGAYEVDGRVNSAILLYKNVIEVRRRVLGNDHPQTLRSRNNLAFTFQNAGMTDQAILIYQDVAEQRLRTLGPDHPHTLEVRHNLAFANEAGGRIDRAIEIYLGVDEDRQRVLGPDHPDTWDTRYNLASAYTDTGRVEEAIVLYTSLVEDQTRAIGSDHPDTLESQNNLAAAYYQANRLAESALKFENVLCSMRRSQGDGHLDLIGVLENLSLIYDELGRSVDRDRILTEISALEASPE